MGPPSIKSEKHFKQCTSYIINLHYLFQESDMLDNHRCVFLTFITVTRTSIEFCYNNYSYKL